MSSKNQNPSQPRNGSPAAGPPTADWVLRHVNQPDGSTRVESSAETSSQKPVQNQAKKKMKCTYEEIYY